MKRVILAAVLLGVVGFPLVTLLLTSTGSHADLATALCRSDARNEEAVECQRRVAQV